MAELKKCRICFTEEQQEEMIAPCGCKGSIKYVHKDCLTSWVTSSRKIRCALCSRTYEGVYLKQILPIWKWLMKHPRVILGITLECTITLMFMPSLKLLLSEVRLVNSFLKRACHYFVIGFISATTLAMNVDLFRSVSKYYRYTNLRIKMDLSRFQKRSIAPIEPIN
ncbi:E3 ubiquitin-protein ligase MARCH1-like isoform X2 [Leptotrombidium deliense]|uniref:E3 ubiquitin-protein ligase MARCH1-like isoform X2 n=1 Tax=Leptotrombidium deliense TaxID=299467 RepID=A0A443RYR7_9ACAR|nr:E3 ubiquitin-protein ligase MARCH1-like isoform X2 [Leptotrombidium deliense]